MDNSILEIIQIIQGQTDLINQLIDRVLELENKYNRLQTRELTDIQIALENGASLNDMPLL